MAYFIKNNTKRRGIRTRKRFPQIYISCEGKNKSEMHYFRSFKGAFNIRYVPCNETDPVSLAQHLISECDKKNFDADIGDLGFCIVDADLDPAKDKLLKKAKGLLTAKDQRCKYLIVSYPCFELWLLLHYKFTAWSYNSNVEVEKELI